MLKNGAMKMHKRLFAGAAYALCGAWSVDGGPNNRWIEWDRTRWAWKDVTCKTCLKRRGK